MSIFDAVYGVDPNILSQRQKGLFYVWEVVMSYNITEASEGRRREMVMEGEMYRIFKVWLTVFTSLCYCYLVGKMTEKGRVRLICVLPIVGLFLLLPLNLNSIHVGGTTAFFIAWLANFKLLLFAFGKGPLCTDHFVSLGRFVAVGCLPIKVVVPQEKQVSAGKVSLINGGNKQNPPLKSVLNGENRENPSQKSVSNGEDRENPPSKSVPNDENRENPSPKSVSSGENRENPSSKSVSNGENRENPPSKSVSNAENRDEPSANGKNEENPPQNSYSNGEKKGNSVWKAAKKSRKSPANYAVKCLLLAMIIRVYDYSEHLHPKLILVLYSFHIYFTLEIILAVVGALARALLGIELEPQFDEPYLSTSLQDFWGRRWNLMVTGILRPTVYEPTLRFTARFVSRRWTSIIAVMMTFTVSGLMHELVFFYLGRVRPTWEITLFFLLHGACLVAENLMRKSVLTAVTGGRWHIPKLVSGVLSIGWVIYTAFWLFFPPLLRSRADDRAFEEYAAVCAFLKNVGKALNS